MYLINPLKIWLCLSKRNIIGFKAFIWFIMQTFFKISFVISLFCSFAVFAQDRVDCIKEEGKQCFSEENCHLKTLSFGERKNVGKCKDAGGEVGQCIISVKKLDDKDAKCLADCFDNVCPLEDKY